MAGCVGDLVKIITATVWSVVLILIDVIQGGYRLYNADKTCAGKMVDCLCYSGNDLLRWI
jgi:hypothetical protein